MSRIVRGHSFLGSPTRSYRGPFKIDCRPVTKAQFLAAYARAFWDRLEPTRQALPVARGARGRKRALDARRPLRGCDHEFSYHEDTIGDGLYTATERWLECDHCGDRRSADWRDVPSYDDWY